MKANELNTNNLMVGDWVRHINGTPYQVTCIKDGHFACSIPHLWEYNNKFEPIPLTTEILKQNGFEEKTESNPFVYYLFKDGDNIVSLEHTYDTTDKEDYWACSIGNRLCDVCTISMHYVHELQHALKLCGITHEISL